MKKILTLALLSITLAVSARAVTIGASAGYLVDGETGYYTARIAHEFKTTSTVSHLGEFEVGYTTDSLGPVSMHIVPLMLNYRAQFVGTGKFSGYLGVGGGISRVTIEGFSLSESDSPFSVQAFVGVNYKANETVTLHLGARYLWIGDADLFGISAKVGDDTALEAGISVKF